MGSAGPSRTAWRRWRSPGPDFSTCSSRTPGTGAPPPSSSRQGERLGRPSGADAASERFNVEFVSANPTGPLTAAGGRHAAYGDSVARVLEFAGHPVEREYYVNDRGGQIDRFGASIAARMKGEPVPEDGYEGEYVTEIAASLEQEGIDATDHRALTKRGVSSDDGRDRGDPPPLQRRLRHLVLGAVAARFGSGGPRPRRRSRGRGRLRERGATWLRTTELRRRQGPRPDPLGGRRHLLPLRHRLPPGQARAGRRPADQRPRR